MIKRGVIQEGITPAEDAQPKKAGTEQSKQASDLEDHVTKRAADEVKKQLENQPK